MVQTESNTQQISTLDSKLNNKDESYSKGDCIRVADTFQRGTEDDGIWTNRQSMDYIDSLQKDYPTGIITLVKDFRKQSKTPWSVLDGGNRCRAIRDYKGDKFTNRDGNKYSDLDADTRAKFNTTAIPCQWITIQKQDSPTTISEMFIRLNISGTKLSPGELIKAHAWKGNVDDIEIAKKIIGDVWSSNHTDYRNLSIREKWNNVFSNVGERKRCNNLVLMTAFIVSAKLDDFGKFSTKYETIKNNLSNPDVKLTSVELNKIYSKLTTFLDIMDKIYDISIFGKAGRGFPAKNKLSPIWYPICNNMMNSDLQKQFIIFYKDLLTSNDLREQYELLTEEKNSDRSLNTWGLKMEKVVKFITEYKN